MWVAIVYSVEGLNRTKLREGRICFLNLLFELRDMGLLLHSHWIYIISGPGLQSFELGLDFTLLVLLVLRPLH